MVGCGHSSRLQKMCARLAGSEASDRKRAMPDYPAAHSMDSIWFAVDLDGNIAFFDTGEDGCLPDSPGFPTGGECGGGDLGLEREGLLARALWAQKGGDARLAALLPDSLQQLEDAVAEADWDELEKLFRAVGVWTYGVTCQPEPYERFGAVASPITTDQLDEQTRAMFAGAKLPVRFSETKWLAPSQYVAVAVYGYDEWPSDEALEVGDLESEAIPDSEFVTPSGDAFYEAIAEFLA